MPDPLVALLVTALVAGGLVALLWPERGLLARRRRSRRLSARVLREDALKQLYVTQMDRRRPTIQSVAGALHITTNEAAEILSELARRHLVEVKDGDFRLTPDGEVYALNVLRAHRLWERYLADETGYAETEWHDRAEAREHTLSEEELAALSAQLGHPSRDPHGDPIPTAGGEVVGHGGKSLTAMPPGHAFRIVHLEDEPEVVYAQLLAEGLYPGTALRLLDVTPSRVRIWADGRDHTLAPLVAANISVAALADEAELPRTPQLSLADLEPKQRGKVIDVDARCRGPKRRRLFDLGILPGTVVEAEMRSPFGDPTAYRVRGALIALRRDQAAQIRIERLEEQPQ